MVNILGIESSCDETAVAIINDKKEILANIVLSQTEEHLPYGGVVPEIASRAHIMHLETLVKNALKEANLTLQEIDAIAATTGPGLIGGLLVGVMFGKSLAFGLEKPFIPVNHLEGHALTIRLTSDIEFPFLLLLVSGGHCQILIAEGVGKYKKLGSTIDDALGEAFDKVAKMLGFNYPGGPVIEKHALSGDERKYELPIPLAGRKGCDFSFSGLKTAVLNIINSDEFKRDENRIANLCASFQYTALLILKNRLKNAIIMARELYPNLDKLVIAGGVAANKYINQGLTEFLRSYSIDLYYPPIKLCTDNGAMIAWAGLEMYKNNMFGDNKIEPRARWDLG